MVDSPIITLALRYPEVTSMRSSILLTSIRHKGTTPLNTQFVVPYSPHESSNDTSTPGQVDEGKVILDILGNPAQMLPKTDERSRRMKAIRAKCRPGAPVANHAAPAIVLKQPPPACLERCNAPPPPPRLPPSPLSTLPYLTWQHGWSVELEAGVPRPTLAIILKSLTIRGDGSKKMSPAILMY